MNALSKLFETLHLSRGETSLRRSHRRRRSRRQVSALSCETLESKQLLAADVAVQFSDQVLDTTDPISVAIEGKFEDTAVSGTVVKFETNAPLTDNDFYVELTDNTPLTNANFLSYVNSGAYDNSKFHRSVSNFVIQGGGFTAPTVPADQPGSDPVSIPTTGTVQNEPGNLNTRGTISMAKLGGQPDSATSQFFFNLENNSFLDSDNGGYTVFGEVLGSGMTVVDTMAGALTYDATTYYSNTALSDLPLWNVNSDNIVRPNDFVKIENADVVTESDLFTYTVSSSDAAKLTASLDGNGNLVLTPGNGATGSVDVTVTATSRLDNSIASDTFSVQLNGGGPVGPVLTAIESNGVVLSQDQNGFLYAGEVALTSGGNALRFSQLRDWTPIAAETVDGTNYLAWQRSGSGSISQWQMDANWAYEAYAAFSSGSPEFAQFETSFNIDADSDGSIGSFRQQVSTDAGLIILDVDTGTRQLYVGDVALTSGGNPLRDNQLSGWAPIGAEAVDGVNYLAWKNNSNGQISRWQMDANWAYQDYDSFYAGTTTFTEFEWDFRIDADGDSRRSIRGDTSGVLLQSDFTTRVLYVGDVALTSGGDQLRDNQLSGWTPIGAETVVGVNYLAWKNNSNGSISRWQMDANWGYQDFSSFSAGTSAFAQFESDFGVDADGDGSVGSSRQAIATDTGIVVLEVDTATRILYVGETALTSGTPLRDNQIRGWTPIAAETVDGVNYLAWRRNTTNSISRWQMDANWAYESFQGINTGAPDYAAFELAFDIDADGDGVKGSTREAVSTDAGLIILDVDTGTRQLYVGDVALTSGGNPLRDNQLSGWAPIGAEAVDGVNYLAWKNNSNGQISRWQMDANWAYQDYDSFYAGTTTFTEFEWDFRIDADGDSRRSIRGDTSGVLLQSDFTTRVLYVGDVALTSGGDQLRDNQLSGWTPIGAETVVGVNYLAWKNNSNGSISRWQMDANWGYQDFSSFSAGTSAFAQFESDFGVDADGDGSVGSSRQAIATDTGIVVLEVDTATRILYVGETALTSGTPLRDNQIRGWTPIAAETVDGVNYLAWRRNTTNSISRWQMDANWAYESYFAFSVGSTAYDEFELAFDIDADGDGSKG